MKLNWDSNLARVASSYVNTLGDSSTGGRGSDLSSSAKGAYRNVSVCQWEQLHLQVQHTPTLQYVQKR